MAHVRQTNSGIIAIEDTHLSDGVDMSVFQSTFLDCCTDIQQKLFEETNGRECLEDLDKYINLFLDDCDCGVMFTNADDMTVFMYYYITTVYFELKCNTTAILGDRLINIVNKALAKTSVGTHFIDNKAKIFRELDEIIMELLGIENVHKAIIAGIRSKNKDDIDAIADFAVSKYMWLRNPARMLYYYLSMYTEGYLTLQEE
jgi:hypothetical protein